MSATSVIKSMALIDSLCSLYFHMRKEPADKGKIRKIQPDNHYHYVPSSEFHLKTVLNYLENNRITLNYKNKINVCDFGSGDGFFLQFLGAYLRTMHPSSKIELVGIEYDKTIKPCGHNIALHHTDFFLMSDTAISQYDILYAYNPLKSEDGNMELLRKLMNGAHVGAHILFSSAFQIQDQTLINLGFKQIDDNPVFAYRKL